VKEKLVYSCTDNTSAEHACSILKENNIPFVKRVAGAGEYLTIVAGSTFNNEINIFVDESNFNKASELLSSLNEDFDFSSSDDIPDELKDISSEEEEALEKDIKKTNNYLKIFVTLVFFVPLLILIISGIISK